MGLPDREYYLEKHGWKPTELTGCRQSLEYDEAYWRKISQQQQNRRTALLALIVIAAISTALYFVLHR